MIVDGTGSPLASLSLGMMSICQRSHHLCAVLYVFQDLHQVASFIAWKGKRMKEDEGEHSRVIARCQALGGGCCGTFLQQWQRFWLMAGLSKRKRLGRTRLWGVQKAAAALFGRS